jgi:hypothetical protein
MLQKPEMIQEPITDVRTNDSTKPWPFVENAEMLKEPRTVAESSGLSQKHMSVAK